MNIHAKMLAKLWWRGEAVGTFSSNASGLADVSGSSTSYTLADNDPLDVLSSQRHKISGAEACSYEPEPTGGVEVESVGSRSSAGTYPLSVSADSSGHGDSRPRAHDPDPDFDFDEPEPEINPRPDPEE